MEFKSFTKGKVILKMIVFLLFSHCYDRIQDEKQCKGSRISLFVVEEGTVFDSGEGMIGTFKVGITFRWDSSHPGRPGSKRRT